MSKFNSVCILLVGWLFVQSVTAQLHLGDLDLNLQQDGGCRCQVIDNNNRNLVLRDFGRVLACGDLALGLCGCGRVGIRSCRSVCEAVVQNWAATTCPAILRGREVRAVFQAVDCANGLGDNTHDCNGRGMGRLIGGIGGLGGLRGLGGLGVVGGLRLGGMGLGIHGLRRAGFLVPFRQNNLI